MSTKQEFMIKFRRGQEYLVTKRRIDFTYYPSWEKSYLKTSDCTPHQLHRLMIHGKNQDFTFKYNDQMIEDFTVDFRTDPNLAIIEINDKFPGYEPGHPEYIAAEERKGYTERYTAQDIDAGRA